MKKIISALVLMMVGLMVIGGGIFYFNSSKITKSDNLYHGKITIGMETWPGYLPLIIAQHNGYFKQAGLDVEIKRYVALGELSKDYVAGKMQGRANLTLDAINEYLEGLDHKVILAIDYSNGSDAIVACKGIDTVKDFRNKKVGFEQNTLEEFFIIWALRESNLEISDIVPVYANPQETARLLREGKIDVGVSHEPFLSQFVSSGNFHTVYSSAQAPGLITDILTFRSDFIESYPETIQAIVKIYFQALRFWKTYPREADAIVALEFGDTVEGIAGQLKGITMLDERDNQTAFTFSAGLQSLYGNMRQIGEFVQNHRQASKGRDLDMDSLIDRKFIRKVYE